MFAQKNRLIHQTLLNDPLTFLGGLLFFLMIFSPAYNVIFKICLIVILLISILISRVAFNRLNITTEVFVWYILFIAHGIFFTAIGFFNGNNTTFILRTTTYNIVWPFFYLLFTIGLYKKQSLYFFIKVIVISNLLISLYLIGSTLTLIGLIPANNIITFDMSGIAADTLKGLVKTTSPSVVCLLFTVPFVIALTLLDEKRYFGFRKWFLNISIIISVIAILLTARRALILNVFLGLFFTILFAFSAKKINKNAFIKSILKMFTGGIIAMVLVFLIIQQFGFLDIVLVYDKFLSAFSGGDIDASSTIRYDQFHLLVRSWLEKPFFGYGHGAVSHYIVRSEKTPWVYELSYAALLFQTGIIGLFTYLCLLLYPTFKGFLLIFNCTEEAALYIIPSIVGCLCFLIANATNPYLISYDYMWALFFPVAVLNHFMKKSHAYQG